jgi:hypothetical protein
MDVALKTTSTASASDLEALRYELANYAGLKLHDNVVSVYGICDDIPGGRMCIVMQCCVYGSLLQTVVDTSTVSLRRIHVRILETRL